jgi:hypothetical protein
MGRAKLARMVHDVILAPLVTLRMTDPKMPAARDAFQVALARMRAELAAFTKRYDANRKPVPEPMLDLGQLAPPNLSTDDERRLLGILLGAGSFDRGARRVASELTSRVLGRRDDWYRKSRTCP